MKHIRILCLLFSLFSSVVNATVTIDADHPYIQYFGRWDFSDPKTPTHSWPGVYIIAKFEGTSIGWITNDNACWYNVFIDDTLTTVFHGTYSSYSTYTLASGLKDTVHTLLITKRGESTWTKFGFKGFVLDDGKTLVEPSPKPVRKIEFIGDSYTSSSGNEWTQEGAPPNDSYTNIYNGFPGFVARHYGAQYHVSSRSGFGLVLDWQGNYSNNVPDYFDRTLFYTANPKWDFTKYVPNVVVICLGLNDYNGWGGYSGGVHPDNAALFKYRYHEFIGRLMDLYPGAKILAVAANDVPWIKQQVSEVVAEEQARGNKNVFYTYFPYYPGEYVNNGHPNVSAHQKIANVIINALDAMDPWTPYQDTIPPFFVSLPDSPYVATSLPCTLNVATSTYAYVRLSTQDQPFDEMETSFTTTGTRTHSVILNGEDGAEYTYYVRAKDLYGNESPVAARIHLRIDTTKQRARWNTVAYNHETLFQSGRAPLGNDGSSSIVTQIQPVQTAYFVKVLTLENPAVHTGGIRIALRGHDGVAVYLNGTYLGSKNMPFNVTANPAYAVFALKPNTLQDTVSLNYSNPLNFLRTGKNIVAIEVHSRCAVTPDILFDAKIFDKSGTVLADFGSEWYYFDGGRIPPDDLLQKLTTVQNITSLSPENVTLSQNYPNPFNPVTEIQFSLPTTSKVEISIFNILGQKVAVVLDELRTAGVHTVQVSAHTLPSGVYFYRLMAGNAVLTRKMMVVK